MNWKQFYLDVKRKGWCGLRALRLLLPKNFPGAFGSHNPHWIPDPPVRESRLSPLCITALVLPDRFVDLFYFSPVNSQETEKQDLKLGCSQQPDSKIGPSSKLTM